jgi:hypothetical protein
MAQFDLVLNATEVRSFGLLFSAALLLSYDPVTGDPVQCGRVSKTLSSLGVAVASPRTTNAPWY